MNEEWVETTLGDVTTFASGYSFSPSEQGKLSGNYPFYKVSDMNRQGNEVSMTNSENWVDDSGLLRLRAKTWPIGTVIFPKVGAALMTEKRRILALPAAFDNNVMGLVATDGILPKYLFALMQTVTLGEYAQQGAVPSVNQSHLSSIPIALPPLPVQRRIVDLMTHLDSHLANMRAERDALVVARDCACDFVTAEANVALGDRVRARGGKRMPKGVHFAGEETSHAYLRVVDMKDGTFASENLEHVPDEIWPVISRYRVSCGELVISIVGSIGRVAIVPNWADGANLTENAAIIDVLDSNLDPQWLAFWLQGATGQCEIERVTVGTSQGKLALSRIPLIEIPSLTFLQQQEQANVALKIGEVLARLSREIRDFESLRSILLSRLLSGLFELPSDYDSQLTEVA